MFSQQPPSEPATRAPPKPPDTFAPAPLAASPATIAPARESPREEPATDARPAPPAAAEPQASIKAERIERRPAESPPLPAARDRDPTAAEPRRGRDGVLNAAMLPGWPPPRPLREATPEAAPAPTGMTDEEMLGYLAEMGLDEEMLAKLRKLREKPAKALKPLAYALAAFAALCTALDSLSDALGARLGGEELSAEEEDEFRRRFRA